MREQNASEATKTKEACAASASAAAARSLLQANENLSVHVLLFEATTMRGAFASRWNEMSELCACSQKRQHAKFHHQMFGMLMQQLRKLQLRKTTIRCNLSLIQ